MNNIIFIAPPAAGKGTASALVCEKYNIPHISTGDLLRDEIANQTKLGVEIKDAMARGEFVSDEVITKFLRWCKGTSFFWDSKIFLKNLNRG